MSEMAGIEQPVPGGATGGNGVWSGQQYLGPWVAPMVEPTTLTRAQQIRRIALTLAVTYEDTDDGEELLRLADYLGAYITTGEHPE